MYTIENYPTKKSLKEAVASGDSVLIYQPGPFGEGISRQAGTWTIEGPHYPEPHRWYARVETDDSGLVVEVK